MPDSKKQQNILVAPLNWGLGHATRCVPIIRALELTGYTPIIASDGVALEMLKKEFPHLKHLELPSYKIEYPKDGEDFKWKMLKGLPRMLDAISDEKKLVKKWVRELGLKGIISDNRLGVFSKKVPSVFMTHQLNVLTGNTSWLTGKLHRQVIRKYRECWVPDYEEKPNLTGKLGHLKKPDFNLRYLGPLSRLELAEKEMKYDLMVILSGPEPQRTLLENRLKNEVQLFGKKVVFIKGKIEAEQKTCQTGNVTYYNFMTSEELQETFNESRMVLSRSGYTTVMDLAKLQKKCFFIPTPGQYEQEYLAKKLKKEGLVPFAKQDEFRIENLLEVDLYQGLPKFREDIHWKNLFCLFQGE
ncbi:glycosyltransferase [Flavobacterium silvaticum]|uniref:Glycosyltransferase n=1 Tax=Flavobacterium silvaticum TaxID=1852020 RepID=A0A972FNK6_9FLAO|nr:glycosyltransferase [Flavobacterium silvaticum]NMH28540.1 glycosyltransferase [Flavobacterium silvaticum]